MLIAAPVVCASFIFILKELRSHVVREHHVVGEVDGVCLELTDVQPVLIISATALTLLLPLFTSALRVKYWL